MESTTQQQILAAGKKEFLAKGFRGASLRNIVKEAGVTTGAFYGYYKSKEALFAAFVQEPAQVMLGRFTEAQETFASLPPRDQPSQMGEISGSCMDWMVGYVYEHFDAVKLLICCAEGTEYEHFLHTMVEIEVEATHRFLAVLRQLGRQTKDLDPRLEHILVSGMFSAFFEIVVHDMPQQQAVNYIHELRTFYTAGWQRLIGF